MGGEYANTAASGGRLHDHPLWLIACKEVAHDLLMVVIVDLEEGTGQGREAMARDGARRLILVKALFAGCGARTDKGYAVLLQQRLDLAILAKRPVYRRKHEVTALQLGDELFWRERLGNALHLKVKIRRCIGVELGFGKAIGMPLLIKIDRHDAHGRGGEVIEQGTRGIEGNTTLQRWTTGEYAYAERFLHIFLFSKFLFFNVLLKYTGIF